MSKSFFSRVIFIPAAVWLSVFFGGSIGSGVEIVQFFTSNGPKGGLIAIAGVAVLMALVMYLCFELSRQYQAYDYRQIAQVLLGKLWWLYEIAILLSMILVVAIASTAAGEVIGKHLDISNYLGQGVCLFIIVFFTYKGREFIEKSMSIASASLLVILAIIASYVFINFGDVTATKFAESTSDVAGPMSVALQYAMVNVAFFPLLLFVGRGIKTGKESIIAAIAASVISVLPILAFHYSFVSHYPDVLNLAAEVPVYWLLEQLGSMWMLDVYVVVLFILIVQTGVGMMQGFVERIDNYLQAKRGKKLTSPQHAMAASSMILLSIGLSTLGIVALILAGYQILFYSFALVFFLPLFTVGVYKIVRNKINDNSDVQPSLHQVN